MQLHQKIAAVRKRKGFTQEQLAELTNINVRTIQRIEGGGNAPRPYTLKVIAAALDVTYEELAGLEHEINSAVDAEKPATGTGDEQYFLQLLCLSCFSYIVIPWVHFLVPACLLKRSNPQNPAVIAFGRQLIKRQVYWAVSVSGLMLLTFAWNFISTMYFQQPFLLNFLWPFFLMYLLNAVLILLAIRQVKNSPSFSVA